MTDNGSVTAEHNSMMTVEVLIAMNTTIVINKNNGDINKVLIMIELIIMTFKITILRTKH